VSNLPVGNYTLSTEASGFKKFVASDIRVNVNDRLDIPVRDGDRRHDRDGERH
jgi:hypothetical protein